MVGLVKRGCSTINLVDSALNPGRHGCLYLSLCLSQSCTLITCTALSAIVMELKHSLIENKFEEEKRKILRE